MSAKVKQTQAPITKSDVKKAVKSAPNDVYVDRINTTAFHAPPELKDSAVVLIVGAKGFPEQFTIHRPIGITDLKEDDWVLTRTFDVETLLARKDDPRWPEIQKRRALNRTKYLYTKGLLVEKDGFAHYKHDMVRTRNDLLDEADKKFKLAKAAGKTAPKANRVNYLDEQCSEAERDIAKALETDEAREAVLKDALQTYRTRGGVLEDIDQKAAPGLRGLDIREVPVVASKILMKTLGHGDNISVTVVDGVKPQVEQRVVQKEEEEDDRDDLINILRSELGGVYSFMTETAAAYQKILVTIDAISPGLDKAKTEKVKADLQLQIKALNEAVVQQAERGALILNTS